MDAAGAVGACAEDEEGVAGERDGAGRGGHEAVARGRSESAACAARTVPRLEREHAALTRAHCSYARALPHVAHAARRHRRRPREERHLDALAVVVALVAAVAVFVITTVVTISITTIQIDIP